MKKKKSYSKIGENMKRPPRQKAYEERVFRTHCDNDIVVSINLWKFFNTHPQLHDLFEDAVEYEVVLPFDGRTYTNSIDMGRIIGRSNISPTRLIGPSDTMSCAVRKNAQHPSRIVHDGIGEQSDHFTIIAIPQKTRSLFDPKKYMAIAAYIGPLSPPEIWDTKRLSTYEGFQRALNFWSAHAFVHDASFEGFETNSEEKLTQIELLRRCHSPWLRNTLSATHKQ